MTKKGRTATDINTMKAATKNKTDTRATTSASPRLSPRSRNMRAIRTDSIEYMIKRTPRMPGSRITSRRSRPHKTKKRVRKFARWMEDDLNPSKPAKTGAGTDSSPNTLSPSEEILRKADTSDSRSAVFLPWAMKSSLIKPSTKSAMLAWLGTG